MIELEKTEAQSEQVAKVENKLVGRWLLKPGQKLYWYDPRTNKMDVVRGRATQFEQGQKPVQEKVGKAYSIYQPDLSHVDLIHSKSSYDPKLMYEMAINDKNAARKFAKRIVEGLKQIKQNEK